MALLFVAVHTPVDAQQVNPTAESVKEEQLLNEIKRITGECSIPDQKACTLEQPRGQDWRNVYQFWLRLYGRLAILGNDWHDRMSGFISFAARFGWPTAGRDA